VLVALAAGCAGCGTPTSPDQVSTWSLHLTESGAIQAPAGASFPPAIIVQGRGIVVLGLFHTPDPCYTFAGYGSQSLNRVTFKLIARRRGEGCIQPLGEFAYQAATSLSPGHYQVEVVHEIVGLGLPKVVRKATVEVH